MANPQAPTSNYKTASTQTVWAGLTRADVRPDILLTAPNTTTPPAEMISDKSQGLDDAIAAVRLEPTSPNTSSSPSLLERRQNRPSFPTRISLPNSEFDDEVLPSPPPTNALHSPLPEANKRYAGHTPLIPRARSPDGPAPKEPPAVGEEQLAAPEDDQPLIGPLMLPTNPVDGASDHIALDVLDDVLEQVKKDQDRFSKLKDAPEPAPTLAPALAPAHLEDAEEDLPLSRKGSADSRKSSTTEVDGVKLKTPPLNFGAPIGQV